MRCSVRSSLWPLLLLTLIVVEVRTQTPAPAAPQPSNWNFMNAEQQAAWIAAQPKEGMASLPLISSVQGPLRPPEAPSIAEEKPGPVVNIEPPPATAPAPTAQLNPAIGYGLAFVLGLLLASGVMLARRRYNNPFTLETLRRPWMTSEQLRIGGMVAGAAVLVIVAAFAFRHVGAVDSGQADPQQPDAAQFAQSQFAIGLLSASGLKVDGPYITERDIADSSVITDQDQRVNLSLTLTPAGATKMRALTSTNIGRDMVFVIDGSPDVAHLMKIASPIGEHAQLSFGSVADAKAFVARLEASRDAHAPYRDALELKQNGHYAEAARLLEKIDSPAAEFNLALLYANGQGVAHDNSKALALLTRAADRGNPAAQTALGIRYATGDGVPQDAYAAAAWYGKAAHNGYTRAQMLIGLAHATGEGVQQNYVEADTWLVLAAASGNARAAEGRDQVELLLTDDERRQAADAANALAEKMAAGKL
jgi:hypothetical protein